MCAPEDVHKNVIHNSQKAKTTQLSTNSTSDHCGIINHLLNYFKQWNEQITVACDDMDKSHMQWLVKEAGSKRYI